MGGRTSSSILQRCSPSFLLPPSLPSPRLLSSLQESALPPVPTILAAEKAVKHQHYLASIANPPVVPGLDVHAAALNAQLARMGVPAGQPAHMAALARVEQQQAEIIAIQKSLF